MQFESRKISSRGTTIVAVQQKETRTAGTTSKGEKSRHDGSWGRLTVRLSDPDAVITFSPQSRGSYGPRSQFGVRVKLLDDSAPVSAATVGTFFQTARPIFRARREKLLLLVAVCCLAGWLVCSRLRTRRRSERTPCSSRSQETRRSSGRRNCGAAGCHCRSQPQDAHQADSAKTWI